MEQEYCKNTLNLLSLLLPDHCVSSSACASSRGLVLLLLL